MPRMKLTDRGVKHLQTQLVQNDYWDTVTPGLALRVSSTGRKVWTVRYLANGKKRRLKLGVYPNMSLSDARDAARDALRDSHAGEDPAQERKDRREGRYTFGVMAEEVIEARAMRTRESTRRERRRLLDKEIIPVWGERELGTITRREVVRLVEAIARRGAPAVANRTLALVRLLFNDGLRRGFPNLEANPAHLVEPPGVEGGRDRYLNRKEIKIIWKALDEETPGVKGAFRLAMLTAQRIGAILAMRWDMIEENQTGTVWITPAADFKGKRPHLVPLSAESLEVLAALKELHVDHVEEGDGSEYVFPSRAATKKPHLANLSGKSLSRVRGNTPTIPHWTLHDFRATFRTHAVRAEEDGGLGLPSHVADAVLGHKEASLGFARYTGDRDRYMLSEKRDALRKWGAFVKAAVKEDQVIASHSDGVEELPSIHDEVGSGGEPRMLDDEGASRETKFRFLTAQPYLDEIEKLPLIGDDLLLIKTHVVLRAGTVADYAEFRKNLERVHAALSGCFCLFDPHDPNEAVESLERILKLREQVASEAERAVQEAGYKLDGKTKHLISPTGKRGRPPTHFRDLVWRVFSRMYPDLEPHNAEGLDGVRNVLTPYFPVAWLTTDNLYQIIYDRLP